MTIGAAARTTPAIASFRLSRMALGPRDRCRVEGGKTGPRRLDDVVAAQTRGAAAENTVVRIWIARVEMCDIVRPTPWTCFRLPNHHAEGTERKHSNERNRDLSELSHDTDLQFLRRMSYGG